MCGIHGIIRFDDTNARELEVGINAMLNLTAHRGPDQKEIVVLPQAALGMNRLSIIAPDERATIQTLQGCEDYALFNGEIVNYQTLRKKLKTFPHDEHTDTAIIMPSYAELGQDFIQEFAGMFAIAIYNRHDHQLQLWRDPMGIKPLYYYESGAGVVFSSEVKAIYATIDRPPEPDFAAIDHMLRYRFHPGRSTVFPEIKRVLPGETVTFGKGKTTRRQYWHLGTNRTASNAQSSVEGFQDLLTQVVQENTRADVAGGFFVSGGLDSSLITSLALQFKESPYQKPISLRFLPKPVADEGYGEILEKHLGIKFDWIEINNASARQALMELVHFLDEPLENPIHIGTYLMAKRARELGIKSVMTGDGSDELFLGYARHGCWFNQPANDASITYPKWLWTLTPDEAHALYRTDAAAQLRPMIDAEGHAVEPFSNVDQVLRFERLDRLSEYHNMRLDRMTMAFGVEAKVPFLDRRIVEYALQIPLATLFGKTGKGWLQEVARPYIPAEILNRKKIHFPSLPDAWLSGEGANWAAEILLDNAARTRTWMQPDMIERYLMEHKSGQRQHGRLLWALLVLELWLQNLPSWSTQKVPVAAA